MLNALLEPAAFASPTGEVLVANGPWKKIARAMNPRGLIGDRLPSSFDHDEGIYLPGGRGRDHQLKIETTPVVLAGESYAFVRATEVAELDALKNERLMLEDYLMRTQAQERRLIARDLHDVTAQLLVGLQLNMMKLKGAASPHDAGPILAECAHTLDELQTTIREFRFTCSSDDWVSEGIGKALERMAASFAGTTGLEIEASTSVEHEPSPDIAVTIYRIAQEALSNVHRHAQATKARLALTSSAAMVHLIVSDNGVALRGRGSEAMPAPGVGLAGIQERVRELDGKISILRGPDGTVIDVTLPVWALPQDEVDP